MISVWRISNHKRVQLHSIFPLIKHKPPDPIIACRRFPYILQYSLMEQQMQELVCPICMMLFRRPLTIPCGHTFCSSCLTNSLREHRSCPICRTHVAITPGKTRKDEQVAALVEHYRRSRKRGDAKKENSYVQCKAERLLLIDVTTDNLLLPYNRIAATFQLQSNALIDRMDRFVARQEAPFNRMSVLCHLVHIEEIRRNLYKGLLQGCSFCTIQSEQVESQLALQGQDEEYFYRTCRSKEISEVADSAPGDYSFFFQHFDRIGEACIQKLIYSRIDPSVFSQRNDPLAMFYCILGILAMPNEQKYAIATTFDEEARMRSLREHIALNEKKIRGKASALVQVGGEGGVWEWRVVMLVAVLCLYFLAQTQDL